MCNIQTKQGKTLFGAPTSYYDKLSLCKYGQISNSVQARANYVHVRKRARNVHVKLINVHEINVHVYVFHTNKHNSFFPTYSLYRCFIFLNIHM